MPHKAMRKFAYLRTSPHMRCRIFCIFAAYCSALFRQIPYIFPHILHQNGPHILRKISALWSCVWCFFTVGAKSDDPLSVHTPIMAPHKMVCLKFEPACKSSIAAKVNMLIYTDVDPVRVTGSHPLMGHCVYETFALLLLKLRVNLNGLSLNIAKIFKEVLYYKFGHAS